MRIVLRRAVLLVVCGAGWFTEAWLIFARDAGSEGVVSPSGLSALMLFLALPIATFVPLARRWDAPLYDLEAAVGWGALAIVVAFVQPSAAPPTWQVLTFLAPLTIACATLLTAVAFCAARRLSGPDIPASFVDARRRGYVGAISLIALGMLAGLGVLSPAIAFLLLGICVLIEALILARGQGTPPRAQAGLGGERRIRSARGS